MRSDPLSANGSKAVDGDATSPEAMNKMLATAARVTAAFMKPAVAPAVRTALSSWARFFNDAVIALQYRRTSNHCISPILNQQNLIFNLATGR